MGHDELTTRAMTAHGCPELSDAEDKPVISYTWLLMLPREALTQCVEELVEAAKTPRFEVTFAAWRSTAEVYAHSELYKTLAGED